MSLVHAGIILVLIKERNYYACDSVDLSIIFLSVNTSVEQTSKKLLFQPRP